MKKEEIYKLIENKQINYKLIEHEPVFNMEDLKKIKFTDDFIEVKNLFVRDDKKRNYYLITIKGDKKINLKSFKDNYKTRNLSFASENDLLKILSLTTGSVFPFGLLNDKDIKVNFYFDKELINETIGIHPNDNTATILIKSHDLLKIIKEHGNNITIAKL